MFRFSFVLLLLLPFPALAQEPEVTKDELPRVPPLPPEKALASFQIRPGFKLELAACEPEVVDPIAMAFDENSALFVVEMRDYSERRADKLSRVRKLEDRDGDGTFEHSTVFLDGLAWATGVTCWDGGVFVAASPDIIYAKDTNGDGVADKQFVVFTGFGEGRKLNVQALVNSLQWGPDNRIHGATAGNGGSIRRVADGKPEEKYLNVDGMDFSFDPRTGDFAREPGTAQFGLTFDEHGEKYVCSNSAHIQWVAFTRHAWSNGGAYLLPPPLVNIPVDGPAAEVFRLSPEEPWRVVRTRWRASGLVPGIIEGGGRSTGYFTSASGVHISGGLAGRGDAFIGDVGSNLVHRKVITWTADGPVAKRGEGEDRMEFLTSTDNWFRPVAFATGPDGGLYIADMYREFIEHPDSLPPAIKKHLDLNSGNDRGRIWRIVPDNFVRKPWPKLAAAADAELAAMPATTSWHTATARRLLHARGVAARPAGPAVPEPERAGREAIRAARTAGRGHGADYSKLAGFFQLPAKDSTGDWQPGMQARLVRAAFHEQTAAKKFFAAAAADTSPLAAMRLSTFLLVPLTPELTETAVRWLWDGNTAMPLRITAAQVLPRSNKDELKRMIHAADQPPVLRSEALNGAAEEAINLVPRWQDHPAELRAMGLTALSVASPRLLLDAVGQGRIAPEELPAHIAAQLRRLPGADKILPPPAANRQEVIAARQGALKLKGTGANGKVLFQQICMTCHRDGMEGTAVGPDRVSFKNQGKPMLLQHILDPNREVAPKFFTAIVTTKKEETYAGIVAEETADSLRLLMPAGLEKVIPRADIRKLDRTNRSLMPEGVEAELTDQDVADLLEFLVQ